MSVAAAGEMPVRPVDIDFESAEIPKYFIGGDIVLSHVEAMLSAMFPDGEKFFMRSVRRFNEQITDPELAERVKGFIGQEAMHGREHRIFNQRLAELGYPTQGVETAVRRGLGFRERIQSAKANLAVTTALEHYTATLAETLMTNEEVRSEMTVPEVRSLFMWHALEESEHKAVAFDVYRHVGGGERLRRVMMNVTTVIFLVAIVLTTTISIARDPYARRHPVKLWRSLKEAARSPWLSREVVRKIRDYQRPDFHPDDWDAAEVQEEWRQRLFGPDGEVTPALRGA